MPIKFSAFVSIFLMGLFISSTAANTSNSLELSRAQTTETFIQSNSSPLSGQKTPPQKVIPATRESIALSGFIFRIAKVAFAETAMGFVPVGMDDGDWLMFVEFELLEGDKKTFKRLEITVSGASGRKSKAVILTSDGIMQILAAVTLKNSVSTYEPGKDNITFVYAVPKGEDELDLNFPTGETIDLRPLKK